MLQISSEVKNLIALVCEGPSHVQQTDAFPNFITEHKALTVGIHSIGQNMRAEREEEHFSLVRAQTIRKAGLGLD